MMAQRDHRVYASTTGGGCRSSVASEGDDRVEVRRAARWDAHGDCADAQNVNAVLPVA
jgi:hypothetical protein